MHAQQTTTVVKEVDGDTVKAHYWGKEESIRLISIKICLSDVSSGKVENNIERLRNTNTYPGCRMFYANLRGANLSSANLISAHLFHAYLTSACLMHSYLNSVNLTDANLAGTDLTYADLSAANLVDDNLTNANLTNTYLSGANFKGANLKHAILNNVEVIDTYFFGVKGLTLKQKKDLEKRGAIIETGETEDNSH